MTRVITTISKNNVVIKWFNNYTTNLNTNTKFKDYEILTTVFEDFEVENYLLFLDTLKKSTAKQMFIYS